MSPGLPITPEQMASLPPEFRALLRAVIDFYEGRIARLESELAVVRAELEAARKTPRNSSLPPSSEHPHAKPAPQKPQSGKKPGGQPGHPKHERALIPVEECQRVVILKPAQCGRCGELMAGSDPQPLRHQVWDLPEIEPVVIEYQRHRLTCSGCGNTSCGELPPTALQANRVTALKPIATTVATITRIGRTSLLKNAI